MLLRVGALLEKTPLKINLAKSLAELWLTDNGASIVKIWERFGGKREALRDTIIKASKTKISGIGANEFMIDGIGAVDPATLAAAITAASPITILMIKLLVDKKKMSKNQAANAAEAVEEIEEKNTDEGGNVTEAVVRTIKKAAPIIEDAVRNDDGGDKPKQEVIKQTTTTNDQTTEGDGASNEEVEKEVSKTIEGKSFFALSSTGLISGGLKTMLISSIGFNGHEYIATFGGALVLTGLLYGLKRIFK